MSPKYFLFAVKVEGESMWPELIPGRRYFASSLLSPKAGSYIVFKNPDNESELFVKRLKERHGDLLLAESIVPWGSSHEFPRRLLVGTILKTGR